ncbi:MAG TPA: hypothetical protein DCL42_02865 [Deltaproteobacteria bacterium]|nr:hypothetical protein [Deltaproteobacteria bacterium]
MARPLRIEYPGAIYHITSRGNNKSPIFKDDHDRESFLNTVRHVNKRYNWLCHAYCLMDNHYHLIIETPDGNLSQGMRQLNKIKNPFILCQPSKSDAMSFFRALYAEGRCFRSLLMPAHSSSKPYRFLKRCLNLRYSSNVLAVSLVITADLMFPMFRVI